MNQCSVSVAACWTGAAGLKLWELEDRGDAYRGPGLLCWRLEMHLRYRLEGADASCRGVGWRLEIINERNYAYVFNSVVNRVGHRLEIGICVVGLSSHNADVVVSRAGEGQAGLKCLYR